MPEKKVTAKQRKFVAERAFHCCEYCCSQAKFATQSFSIEHVRPRSKGGKTVASNLAFACQGCNAHKYNKTKDYDPISGKIVELFHPREHKWEDHFKWNDDFSLVIGLTPTGRATVETLKLNRKGIINLRKVLYSMGEHPPKY